MLQRALVAVPIAILAMALILTPIAVLAIYGPEAAKFVESKGNENVSVTGSKAPCAGYFDYGLVVVYRLQGSREDKVGRLCRGLFESKWNWYPSTNEMTASTD